jgi:hypothetical protein
MRITSDLGDLVVEERALVIGPARPMSAADADADADEDADEHDDARQGAV